MHRTPLSVALILSLAHVANARWPARTIPDVPRRIEGHVNLTSPARRTSHGTPDYRDCGRQNPIRRENLGVWKTRCFRGI